MNPVFQYDKASFCEKPELVNEMRLFRERLESFGQERAFETRRNTRSDEWSSLFGGTASNLRKLGIQILGQTSTSSGCERNWSVFEHIHTKKGNRLERQRLNDLVYVHYNLKLKDDDDDQTDDNEVVEVDDDVDLSSFDRFYIGDDLHDVSIGVGICGSTSGGGTNEDDDEWLRRED